MQEINQPANEFLSWVSTLLPNDKYLLFVSLFRFPVDTVELTSRIYEQLEKVFDGKNPVEYYKFTDQKYLSDWENYRKNKLNQPAFWRSVGWDTMRTSVNSVMVIDMPETVTEGSEFTEPYVYFVDISKVLTYELKENISGVDSAFDSIIYQTEEKTIVLDDEFYRVVTLSDSNEIKSVELEVSHNLGYCPATFFWSDALVVNQPDIKANPISKKLSAFDWLLFWSISKKQLDLSGAYPIFWAYEAECDYKSSADYCDKGFLKNLKRENYTLTGAGAVARCPVCEAKRLTGAGSLVEMPVPESKDDPDLKEPVGIVSVDVKSLEYNVEELNRLDEALEVSIVGVSKKHLQSKQAFNIDQVRANYDTRTTILNNLKSNFEKAIMFANNTSCKLRYQSHFLGSYYSMGTEFYTYTISDLYKQYQEAKALGTPEHELDNILQEIIITKYRNDPDKLNRMQILWALEPYRHYGKEELIKHKDLLESELVSLKLDFPARVDRFEREQGDISEFGSAIDFKTKIDRIKQTLLSYGNGKTAG